jgi:REP element-mobilizing transposase RayT
MANTVPLQNGQYYHIYNRGNNKEPLFKESRNYAYFLKLYTKYINPVADTYAYCLLNNHFHLLVRIRDCQSFEDWQSLPPSRSFSNLFSTYTKAFNKAYKRTGSLFEKPFKRKLVDDTSYLIHLTTYIHQNPQKHGFVDDFRNWPYSSYGIIISSRRTSIYRAEVLDWFGGPVGFENAHEREVDETAITVLIVDDDY